MIKLMSRVPTFAVPSSASPAAPSGGLKRSATVPTAITALVTDIPTAATASRNLVPAPDFAGKLRW